MRASQLQTIGTKIDLCSTSHDQEHKTLLQNSNK